MWVQHAMIIDALKSSHYYPTQSDIISVVNDFDVWLYL